MNTALWVVQIVLAVLYVIAGLSKIAGQGPMLEKMMPGFSLALIRLVGLGETLAGLGPVRPAVARRWTAVAGWAGAILAAGAGVVVFFPPWRRAYVPAGASLVFGRRGAFGAWGELSM